MIAHRLLRILRRSLALAATLALVVAATAAWLAHGGLEQLRPTLVERLTLALGRHVEIQGPLELDWSPLRLASPGLCLGDSQAQATPLVCACDVVVVVDPASVFEDTLVLPVLHARDVVVSLVREADGAGNWEFGGKGKATDEVYDVRPLPVLVEDGRIDGARILWSERGQEPQVDVDLQEISVRPQDERALVVRVLGNVSGEAVRASLDIGTLAALREGRRVAWLADVEAGGLRLALAGAYDPGAESREMEISASADDLAAPLRLIGVDNAPAGALELTGKVRRDPGGWRFENVTATLADHHARIDGTLGSWPALAGSNLEFSARGPSLAPFSAMVATELPAGPWEIAGRLRPAEGRIALEDVHASLVAMDLTAQGQWSGADGTDIRLSIQGADLSRLPGWPATTRPPRSPFHVGARLRSLGTDLAFSDIDVDLGLLRATGSASSRDERGARSTRLDLAIEGADLGAVLAAIDFEPNNERPRAGPAAFTVAGTIVATAARVTLDTVRARVDGQDIEANGTLSADGADLRLAGSGPRFDKVVDLLGWREAPRLAWSLDTGLSRSGERWIFDVRRLVAGDSDLAGSVALLAGTPLGLEISARGPRLDLEPLQSPDEPDSNRPDRVLPDATLDFGFLTTIAGRLDATLDVLEFEGTTMRDVRARATLADQTLKVESFDLTSPGDGHLTGKATFARIDNGARVDLSMTGDDFRTGLFIAPGASIKDAPAMDLALELHTRGDSLRSMLAAGTGWLELETGEGRLEKYTALQLLGNDIFNQLAEFINPFSTSRPYMAVDCAAGGARLAEGSILVDRLVVRSDKQVFSIDGTIDVRSEKLKLAWATKSRQGIGLSASKLVTPYLVLKGTLAHPKVSVDAGKGLKSTARAVATGGLSIVGGGLWDRYKAEGPVCAQALAEVRAVRSATGP